MTDVEVDAATGAQLLETIRTAAGCGELAFQRPPTRLTGGFYAEMLRFRLVEPPADLDRELVARIVPSPAAGAWEATVQQAVAQQGFPTPAVRLTAPASGPLGRFLIVMDAVDGEPPLAGLGPRSVATQLPRLVRDLPTRLARIAADLHALDPAPLAERLAALDDPFPLSVAGWVEQQGGLAAELGRPDVAAAARRLLAEEPPSTARVITHGDLHPFNLLVTAGGPVLVDWTVARVAHPAFTVGFTDLLLSHPPVHLPGVPGSAVRRLGRSMARRFLGTYRRLTDGTPGAVADDQLDWHRRVHALRILVELAGWDAAGTRPTAGHPWLVLEPVAARLLGLDPPPWTSARRPTPP